MPKISIQLDAGDAIRQINTISDSLDKLQGRTKEISLKVKTPSQATLKAQIDTLKIPDLKADLKVNAPTQAGLKAQLDKINIPDLSLGLKIKSKKADLQTQLDKIIGQGLSVKIKPVKGGNGSQQGFNTSGIEKKTQEIIDLLKNSHSNPVNFDPTKVPNLTGDQRRNMKAFGYYNNSISKAENADTNRRDLEYRKSFEDENRLIKEQRAMLNELKLSGSSTRGYKGIGSGFFSNFVGDYVERRVQGNRFASSIRDARQSQVLDREIKKTDAFKNTGKEKFSDLTTKEKTAVWKEMRSSGAMELVSSAGKVLAPALTVATKAVEELGKAALQLGKESIEAYKGVQTLQTQLGVVFGSTAESGSMFSNLESYAKKSPFGVETMTQEAVLLKQSGVYSSELMDMISRIGDISSGNNEKMKSISETYSRVLASSTVTARDMRQLANAGVPIYREMAKQLGVQQSQVRSMLQSGKVRASDMTAVIKNLTSEGGMFEGATAVGAKTLAAKTQNLEDAKQMGKAAIGEWLTRMGSTAGQGTQSSFYSKFISFIDGFWNGVEEHFDTKNNKKTVKNSEKVLDNLKSLREETKRLKEDADSSRIKNGSDSLEYKTALEAYEIKKEEYDEYARDNANFIEQEIAAATEFMGKFEGIKVVSDDEWKKMHDKYGDEYSPDFDYQLWNQYQATHMKDIEYKNELKAFKNPNRKSSNYTGLSLEDLVTQGTASQDFTKNADALDAIIQDQFGSVGLRQNAIQAWNNGTLGKAYEQREEYERDAALRKRLYSADDRYLKNGTYQFGDANLKELADAFDLLAESSEKLKISLDGLMDGDALSEEGHDDLALAKERIDELYTSLANAAKEQNMTITAYAGLDVASQLSGFLNQLEQVTEIKAGTFLDPDNIKNLALVGEMYENLLETLEKNKGRGFKGAEETLTALEKVMTKSTLSSAGKEKLNARTTASLWAQVLSSATGIDATRISLDGRNTAVNAYRNNLSQRQMFSDLSTALLGTGISFGDITSNLKRTGTGYDGTSLYDWNAGMKGIEAMASETSASTQQALIDAYQSQIDTLNKLEVAGLATVDSWSELEYISQGLGSAFNVTAEKLADGTYKFTDATIQAVEEMKKELSAKKFAEEISNVFKSAQEQLNSQSSQNIITKLTMKGAFGNMALTPEDMKAAGAYYSTAINDKILKNEDYASNVLGIAVKNGEVEKLVDDTNKLLKSLGIDDTVELTKGNAGTKYYDWTEAQVNAINDLIIEEAKKEYEKNPTDNGWVSLIPDIVKKYVNNEKGTFTILGNTNATFDAKDASMYTIGKDGLFTSIKGSYSVQADAQTVNEQKFKESLKKIQEMYEKGELNDKQAEDFANILLETSKYAVDLESSFKNVRDSALELDQTFEALSTASVIGRITSRGTENEPGTTIANVDRYSSHYEPAVGGKALRMEALGLNANANEKWAYEQFFDDNDGDRKGWLGETQQAMLKASYLQDAGFTSRIEKDLAKGDKGKIGKELAKGEEGKLRGKNKDDINNMLEGLNSNDINTVTNSVSELYTILEEMGMINPFQDSAEGLMTFYGQMQSSRGTLTELGKDLYNLMDQTALNGLNNGFTNLGKGAYQISKGIKTSAEAEEEFARNIQQSAAEMLNSMGPLMTQAGLSLIKEGGKANIAMGLALIAAGGVANFLGGYLSAEQDETDKSDDEYERLQKMKDNLADLLRQARDDAAYYETTLRAKKAISTNEGYSTTPVHDMILTPQGRFSTDPDDYIIASKNPSALGGGAMPNISVNVINTGNSQLSVENTQMRKTQDGFELDVIVNGIVKSAMADGEYDDYIEAAQERKYGYQTSA